MCRQNQLLGVAILGFGLGMLIGIWLDGGFFGHCFALGMAVCGLCMLRRK